MSVCQSLDVSLLYLESAKSRLFLRNGVYQDFQTMPPASHPNWAKVRVDGKGLEYRGQIWMGLY
jgi:hypothetical protein